jgi:alkaline phosphatase D
MTWDDHAGFRLRSPPNLFATSITTYPPPYELFAKVLPDNPHVKFFG